MRAQPVDAEVTARVAALTKRIAGLQPQLALPIPGGLGGDSGPRVTNLPGQLASVKLQLIGATAVPTAIQRRTLAQSRVALAAAIREANDLAIGDLPAVTSLLQRHGLRVPPLPALAPLPAVSQ